MSQRKLVKQVFGWMKTVDGLRKLRHRGGALVDWNVTLTEFITPAIVIALFAWLRSDISALGKRIDSLGAETNKRFDSLGAETNRRFDEIKRDNADLRERMAMFEGSLNGFLAGRRDRDAA